MAYNNFTNEDLRMQADKITDDSLQSTRRMKELLYESADVGANTLVMLDEQGEQLERVNKNLDIINEDCKEVEKHLTDMEKCCGLCLCPCKRIKSIEKSPEYGNAWKQSPKKEEIITKQPVNGISNVGPNKGPYVEKIMNDEREVEMDDNLGDVSNLIGNLQSMAVDMGRVLDYQNILIDTVTDKAETVDLRIVQANKRTTKMLNK